MANFCGKCGSPLNDDGTCTKCGTDNLQENVAQPATAQVPDTTTTQTVSSKKPLTKAQKAKIKFKVKISKKLATNKVKRVTKWKKLNKSQKFMNVAIRVVATLLALTLVASVVCGILVYCGKADIPFISSIYDKLGISKKSNTLVAPASDDEAMSDIISYDGISYYNTGYMLIAITDDKTQTPVVTTDERIAYVNSDQCAFDGKFIYTCSQNNELIKYKFVDKNTVEESVWVQSDTLSDAGISESDSFDVSYMKSWCLYDDYIYFNCIPSVDQFDYKNEHLYRLGRISLDGKHIEFLGDECASAFTVSDGYIYFQHNGYVAGDNPLEINKDRVGIYKMKCDGSDKKLIYSDFEYDIRSIFTSFTLCSEMQIHDNYLYFVNGSIEGEGRICRMKLDGSDVEYLSQNSGHGYTLDKENNTLYYIQDSKFNAINNESALCKVDIKTKEETVIQKYEQNIDTLNLIDGYVYFTDDLFTLGTKSSPDLSGIKYNITDNKLYSLYGYRNAEMIFNEETGIYEPVMQDPAFVLYWEENQT